MSYNRDGDEVLEKPLSVYQKPAAAKNPINQYFRLRKPCSNCPFLKEGAIKLSPGRLEGIVEHLLSNDGSSFHCHKTVHSKRGGEFGEDGEYQPSGNEAMCAGAAAYLMKQGRPSISMRLAFMGKAVQVDYWNEAMDLII